MRTKKHNLTVFTSLHIFLHVSEWMNLILARALGSKIELSVTIFLRVVETTRKWCNADTTIHLRGIWKVEITGWQSDGKLLCTEQARTTATERCFLVKVTGVFSSEIRHSFSLSVASDDKNYPPYRLNYTLWQVLSANKTKNTLCMMLLWVFIIPEDVFSSSKNRTINYYRQEGE